MNRQEAKPCPFCGSENIGTAFDYEQGMKWGTAVCLSCGVKGPEVRTGYDKSEDAGWRTDAIDEWNYRAMPTPDPITGLVPCGCGGKAGFHYSVMMRDNDCYVECGICGGHTKVVLSEDKARDAWNTAMGWRAEE